MFKRLHPLYEIDGAIGSDSGVENVSAAEIQDVPNIETGVDNQGAADQEKQNNFEKAFAKRLAAKEAEWEAKNAEKYKDYETHQKASQFLQKRYNISDAEKLREEIELADLQEQADQQNVPLEVIQRIKELEAKAESFDKLSKEQEQQQQYQTFRSSLEKFAGEKGVQADDLHKFMYENGIASDKIELAYKAMKADELESKQTELQSKQEEIKKSAVKEYLDSKKAPKAEGKGAAGTLGQGAPGSWQAADARFKARIEAANKSV